MLRAFKPYIITACIINIVFVLISVIDIVVAKALTKNYTLWYLLVIYSIGGVFASIWSFLLGMKFCSRKSSLTKWGLISFLITAGIISAYWLSNIEEGAYKAAFRGYGISLILGSLLFVLENDKKQKSI
ncbi:MAG: hypothetical protein JST23_11460 [Bacteroidetes bacterium]|nr:hypothetical protein [Bacteroidota bacterium]